MIDHDRVTEAPPMPRKEVKTLPLEYCYLATAHYRALVDHGVTDFTKVKSVSCVKNPNSKSADDYFITTVTHVQTEDGSPKTFAFFEFRPNWLDDVPWRRKEDNFGVAFGSYRDLATRHGIPIAFYFEYVDGNEQGELAEMKEDGIDPYEEKEEVAEPPKKDEIKIPEVPPRLEPCPKCGKDAAWIVHPAFDGGAYVSCPKCHFGPQLETWAPTDAEAAVKWNNLERK